MNPLYFPILLFLTLFTLQSASATHDPIPRISDIKKMHPNRVKDKAEHYFTIENYQHAYYYYQALSQMKRHINQEQRYRLGKTAIFAQEYSVAQKNLEKLLKKHRKFELVYYEYATSLKHLGHYQKATTYFQEFIAQQSNKESNPYVAFANRHIAACESAQEALNHPSNFAIGEVGNSFAEAKGALRSITNFSEAGYRLIEYQEDGRGSCIKLVTPDMELKDLNHRIGDPVFNARCPHIAPDGRTVYFSQQEHTMNGNLEFKIYQATIDKDGAISNLQKLGAEVNRDGHSSLYPCLGLTDQGQEILYFSSTLPGGEGGFDLWYAVRMANGDFTRAYNLGMRINTEGDEITPFYYQQGGELFYSSNRADGYGGFDIYKLTGEKRRWIEDAAENLGFPINSQGDDTHFVKDKNGQGFFTTDREGKTKTIRQSEVPAVVEP